MERMSPLDAAFLEAEDEDPGASLAIASIAVFEGPAPTTAEFAATSPGGFPSSPATGRRHAKSLSTSVPRSGSTTTTST